MVIFVIILLTVISTDARKKGSFGAVVSALSIFSAAFVSLTDDNLFHYTIYGKMTLFIVFCFSFKMELWCGAVRDFHNR